jgi:hypothetical protein
MKKENIIKGKFKLFSINEFYAVKYFMDEMVSFKLVMYNSRCPFSSLSIAQRDFPARAFPAHALLLVSHVVNKRIHLLVSALISRFSS